MTERDLAKPPDLGPTPEGATTDRFTVSVVIPTFNTSQLLHDCLRSVESQAGACDLDVVVVDNGSTDGTAEMVQADFPTVTLVRSAGNRGYSGGVNLGLSAARESDLTVVLNSDTIVHEGAFEEMCRHLAALDDVGAACPRCLDSHGDLQSYGTILWGAWDFARQIFGRPVVPPARDPEASSYVGSASGACLCFTRRGRRAIGRFDEDLVLYLEEQDLARRLTQQGLRCYYVAPAGVTHLGGRTTALVDSNAVFEATHLSHAHFFAKHFQAAAPALRLLGALTMVPRIGKSLIDLLLGREQFTPRERLRVKVGALRGYLGLSGREAGASVLDRF